MQKLSYKTLFTILFLLLIAIVVLLRFFILKPNSVSAAWWNENWNYRQAINISSHDTAESNVYIIITVNISTATKSQSDNGDFRFTTQAGSLLPYYISSGVGTTNITFHIQFDSFPSGAQTIYAYYGNSSAQNGFSTADFATQATNYNKTLSTEEVGGGPVAYWKFDEGVGTTAYDSSSKSNNGVLGAGSSAPTWTDESQCISGKCLQFSGSHYVNNTNTLLSNVGASGSVTISAWIKPSNITGNVFNKGSSGNCFNYGLRISSGKLQASNTSTSYNLGGNITTGKWQHVAVVYDSSGAQGYIDGKPTLKNSSVTTSNCIYNQWVIGARAYNALSTDNFSGIIDEFKIYPYARTAAQVKLDYNSRGSNYGSSVNLGIKSNTAPDLSSKLLVYYKFNEGYGTTFKNYGTLGSTLNGVFGTAGTIPVWLDGKYDKGLGFGTSSTAISSNTSPSIEYDGGTSGLTNGFTLSCWMKADLTETDGGMLISRPWNSSGRYNYTLTYSSNKTISLAVGATTSISLNTGTGITVPRNEWHYVAATIDPTTQTSKIYIDGKLSKTGSNAGIDWNVVKGANTTRKLAIGCMYPYADSCKLATSLNFKGLIDEVKIYNTALTADEITQDYNQSSAIVMGATNQTIGGTTTNLEYCVPGDTSACAAPVAQWNFEENIGTTAYDTSGNNRFGIFGPGSSSPTWTIGKNNSGSGLKFNGAQYINIATTTPTINSISFWTKPTTTSQYFMDFDGGTHYISVSSGVISATGFDIPNIYVNGIGTSSITANTWQHITVTTNTGFSGTALTLGKSTTNFFNGSLDQIKIYDYARNPAQIAYDYNKGAPIGWWKFDECQGSTVFDSSRLGNTGAISIGLSGSQNILGTCQVGTSAAWTAGASGKINSSLNFDGNDDYVDITTKVIPDNSSQYSACAWFKVTGSLGTRRFILETAPSGFAISIGIQTDEKVELYVNQTTGTPNIKSNQTINLNNWYHVCSIFTQNDYLKLYLNGKLENLIATGNYGTVATTGLHIGTYRSADDRRFNGQIDDVRIYNYALTDTQVKTLYNGGAVSFN